MVNVFVSVALVTFTVGILSMLYVYLSIGKKYPKMLNSLFVKAVNTKDISFGPGSVSRKTSIPFVIYFQTALPRLLKDKDKFLYLINVIGIISFFLSVGLLVIAVALRYF